MINYIYFIFILLRSFIKAFFIYLNILLSLKTITAISDKNSLRYVKNTKQNIELVSKASPFQNNGNINQHDRPKTQNGTDSFNRPPPNRQPFERNENINNVKT